MNQLTIAGKNLWLLPSGGYRQVQGFRRDEGSHRCVGCRNRHGCHSPDLQHRSGDLEPTQPALTPFRHRSDTRSAQYRRLLHRRRCGAHVAPSAREPFSTAMRWSSSMLGDPVNLCPNMPRRWKAAETLVMEGFEVMVPRADQIRSSAGCWKTSSMSVIMPLASPDRLRTVIVNRRNLRPINR